MAKRFLFLALLNTFQPRWKGIKRITQLKNKFLNGLVASFALAVSGLANAGMISVIDGDHSVIKGWAYADNCTTCVPNSYFDGLEALGYTSSLFDDSATGWSSAFSSPSNIIIVEQGAGDFVSLSDLTTFVSGGGHVIQLGGSAGSSNILDKFFGTSFGYGSSLIGNHTITLDAIGTAFEGYAGVIDDESSTHGYNTSALLSAWGGKSIMANAGQTSVWQGNLGSGKFTYLAYDYCCSSGVNTRDAWSEVLHLSISGVEVTSVPEPSTLAVFALGLFGLASRKFKK